MSRKISREAKLARLQALQGRDGAGKQIGISGKSLYRYRTGKRKIPANIARRIDSAYHLIYQDTMPTYKTIKSLRKSQRGKLQNLQKQGSKYFAIDKVVIDVTGRTTDEIREIVDIYRGKDFLSSVVKVNVDDNWKTFPVTKNMDSIIKDTYDMGPVEQAKKVTLIIWLRRRI